MPKLKITYKMAIILSTMSFGPMLAGSLSGLVKDESLEKQKQRSESSLQIATLCSNHLSVQDLAGLQKSCRKSLSTVEDLLSLRIIRRDGLVLYASPDHSRNWNLAPESPSTINHVRVPLEKGEDIFAELEIAFTPAPSGLYSAMLRWAIVVGVGFFLNVGSFSLFLNKAFGALDPKSAVPKRVRNTLDTIVGGVVILDVQGKILLANDSFARCVNLQVDELTTRELNSLTWGSEDSRDWPWESAIREQSQKAGVKLYLNIAGKQLTFMVNATPVFDGEERITGALVSFEDISLMEKQRQHLLSVLSDLETSREQIKLQNEVLHELATRDGLTGALNRRALYEKIDALWENRNDGERGLISIMMDVDHFKKLNDRHGHAAGDAVLKDVVKTVSKIVEGRGILGRYGGEEFCVVMQHATLTEGEAMAEEIRAGLQTTLAEPYKVTASLGVSSSILGAPTFQAQIEQSDQGLYAAKHSGRNRFRTWSPELEETAKEEERKKAAKLASIDVEEHPISYHAVVTLNAAMTKRFPLMTAHSHRVAEICVSLAKGLIPVGELYVLEIAAMLHDIGCLTQNETDADWKLHHLRSQSDRSNVAIKGAAELLSSSFNSPAMLEIINSYSMPLEALAGTANASIPFGARVLSIANAYDTMTSELSDAPMSHQDAIEAIQLGSGTLYDPELVERFANSPFCWRPQFFESSDLSNSNAVMIGYQIERVIHCFESGNLIALKSRLESLKVLSNKIDMPMIGLIVNELQSEAERKSVSDWESIVPMLQDLVEMCLMIQRAYLRPASRIPVNG